MSDDRVVVDLTGDLSNNPDPGAYVGKVVKCESQKAKDGSSMIYWEFELVDAGEFSGRKVWTNTSLKPAALWRLRDLVNALGEYPGPEGFSRTAMLGKMCRLVVDTEAYCKVHNTTNDGCPAARKVPRIVDYAPLI